ncbi:MAG: NUDIX domain-containing protein [Verrucomicrobia bacterium]|nr:NUDIX domain-containing protein [Verrucomicrobiota bacterium]
MSHEIFDVVNDRDKVIGRQTRAEVHRLGLKHRAVHVLVLNAKGQIYLQKRSHQKDTFPGAWDSSASGHLNSGENYDACAVRELREEIGVVCKETPHRLFKVEACAATGQEFVWVYRLQYNGPFKTNSDEVEFGSFFRPDDVERWVRERPRDFASAFVLIWKWFQHGKPKQKPKPSLRKSEKKLSAKSSTRKLPKATKPARGKPPGTKKRGR